LFLAGCHKDLDRFPPNDVTSEQLFVDEAGYNQVLAKVYGSMALTGNAGPATWPESMKALPIFYASSGKPRS
jgi:starch-binding outer membrane protein, SusD/RagB family